METNHSNFNAMKKYRKTIISAMLTAIFISLSLTYQLANSKLKGIKLGDYAEQPYEERHAMYQDALPSVITEAIIRGIIMAIILFIIYVYIHFRVAHDINFLVELKHYLREKKEKVK